MKKIMIIAAAVLAMGAQAQTLKDIHIAGGVGDVMQESSKSAYEVGYGVTKYFDSGLMSGVSFNFGMVNGTESSYTYGADLSVGLSLAKKLSVYGIGSATYQTFKNTGGSGFGYGGGAEYRFNDTFAAAAEYKTYNMVYDSGMDYDYSTSLFKLKYTF
jgi:hypothetical protein